MINESEIPKFINKGEAAEYVFVCIKSKDNRDGTAKIHQPSILYAPQGKYNKMVKDIPRHKGIFNGMFNKVVILHDPTVISIPKAKKEKGLSPKHKKAVKEMLEAGQGQDDAGLHAIAEELGVTFERVKAYIQSF